jgi:phosphohistidine swiveling domain-containing protein
LQEFADAFTVDSFCTVQVRAWQSDPARVLDEIASANLGDIVIVRSSAENEDSASSSMAGMFHSEKGVRGHDRDDLSRAIELVLDSYRARGTLSAADEVVVQTQMQDSLLAGVLMTRDPRSGAPYYMIDFDRTVGRTDAVTSGLDTSALRIFHAAAASAPEPWNYVLAAVCEIEARFPGVDLEIEFGVGRDMRVHIFQARPLVDSQPHEPASDCRVFRRLNEIRTAARAILSDGRYGAAQPVLSDMADWNPAEMLGHSPDELSYSLYRELITRNTWRQSRVDLGYTDVGSRELMSRLGTHPYIDVHASLCSLVPARLPSRVRERIVGAYLNHLRAEPHLHDKIEFAIAYSCADPASPRRTMSLTRWGASRVDVEELDSSLVELTSTLLRGAPAQNEFDMRLCARLNSKARYRRPPIDAGIGRLGEWLRDAVRACRDEGVLPFARLARQAFVGEDLLRRLVAADALRPEQRDHLLASVPTVAGAMRNRRRDVQEGRATTTDFLREFGHLRPGSYNICSPRYDQQPELVLSSRRMEDADSRQSGDPLDRRAELAMERSLQSAGISLTTSEFVSYVRTSAECRDRAKFVFSRLLSDIIEVIADIGALIDLQRSDMAYLNVNTILSADFASPLSELRARWQEESGQNRAFAAAHAHLVLPAVLTGEDDLLFVPAGATSPNFVTNGVVQADLIRVDGQWTAAGRSVDGCIALVEAADPGYDWMFTQGIVGLITRYGGMASHMAVRCHELRIPAVIGCGDNLFEKLQRARVVRINAQSRQVTVVEGH